MRRQKMRTLLTMFGIFWGTAAIVLLFAFGQGIKEAQIKSLNGIGENIIIFWPGITSQTYNGLPKGRRIRFTEDDISLVKIKATKLRSISPEYSRGGIRVSHKKNAFNRQIAGVWPEFGPMRNLIPQFGSRFINDLDMAKRRRVVFIGDRLKQDLFGDQPAVGETILIQGTPFVVIGVMQEKDQDSSYSGRDQSKMIIPSTTFKAMFSNPYLNNFVVQARSDVSTIQTTDEVYEIFGARYQFDPSDKESLSVWDVSRGFAFLKTFFVAFQSFLVGIGVATLITGGIGVSNIMNVVLEERTKEIGIKMALGARKSYIISQFMIETFVITLIGGSAGFIFAAVLVAIFPRLGWEQYVGVPSVDYTIGILAIGLLGIVGFLAGIFPARRAANLQPVQALKLY